MYSNTNDKRSSAFLFCSLLLAVFAVSSSIFWLFLLISHGKVVDKMDIPDTPGVLLFDGDRVNVTDANYTNLSQAACTFLHEDTYDCKFDNGEFHTNVPLYYSFQPRLMFRPAIRIVCPRLLGGVSRVVLWDKCSILIGPDNIYAEDFFISAIILIFGTLTLACSILLFMFVTYTQFRISWTMLVYFARIFHKD